MILLVVANRDNVVSNCNRPEIAYGNGDLLAWHSQLRCAKVANRESYPLTGNLGDLSDMLMVCKPLGDRILEVGRNSQAVLLIDHKLMPGSGKGSIKAKLT